MYKFVRTEISVYVKAIVYPLCILFIYLAGCTTFLHLPAPI